MTKEITAKLRSLDLSYGGSHSRLSAIASCFLEPAFGWTRGACEELRNMLIKLLEDADGNDDNDSLDDCNRNHHCCDQRQMSYNELGNERHKAVRRLRKLDGYSPLAHNFREALAAAIDVPRDGAPYDDKQLCHLICDRLIHLLGGDQPTLSDLFGILQDGAESENRGSESAHKMTKSAEIGEFDERVRQLEHDVKMWRDRAEDMRMERDELQEKNDELQEKNRRLAEKCDEMLVLLSNRAMDAKSDQEQRIEKLVRQREELWVKLKKIGDIVNG